MPRGDGTQGSQRAFYQAVPARLQPPCEPSRRSSSGTSTKLPRPARIRSPWRHRRRVAGARARARRRRRDLAPARDRAGDLAPVDRPRATRAARHADPGRDPRRARDAARVRGLAAARPLHLPAAQRAGVRAARPRPRLPRRGARRESAAITRRPVVPLLVLAVATAWAVGGLRARPPRHVGAVPSCRSPPSSCAAATQACTRPRSSSPRRSRSTAPARHLGVGVPRPDRRPSAANPPSGIPGGYCWLDFWALRSPRTPAARAGARRAAVQACSSGAIVRPKPPS